MDVLRRAHAQAIRRRPQRANLLRDLQAPDERARVAWAGVRV